MKTAIIVGAGIAGIATGIRLAAKGYAVQIYETNDYPGGKLSSFSQDGFRFDAGPSLFTLPHLVTELFELHGEQPEDYFTYEKKNTICNYFWDDGKRFVMPAESVSAAKAISNAFDVDAEVIERYLHRSATKYQSTQSIFLEKSLHKWKTYLSKDVWKALMALPKLDLNTSLHTLNKRTFDDPRLVQLFDRYATYNGSSPYQTPGIMSMIPHLEMGLGTYFPHGGMESITNALVALAERAGVAFRYRCPIDKIIVKEGRAVGVRSGDQIIQSDLVVSNMDIFSTYERLLPEAKKPMRVLDQERSSSALIFYWGMQGTYPELDLHNIFFSKDYSAEFERIFKQKTCYHDPTVYINVSSKCNPSDAPGGHENWFVMINTPGDFGQEWPSIIMEMRTQIQAKLSKALGRNIADHIVSERILDPRLIQSYTSSHRGSLYGTASNSKFAAFLRHANFSKNISDLYFVGGSVHPGGGIPLCLNSAKIVSNLI